MNYGQMLAALRQRKLVQTIVVYVGVSWGILQVLSFFGTTYDWPRAVIDVSLFLLSCGFVVAVTVAWFHGERGHQDVTRAELTILLIVLIVAAPGGLDLARRPQGTLGMGGDPPPPPVPSDSTVAVLPFVNRTGDDSLAWLQGGLAEMLTTDLAQAPQLHLVSGERVYDLLHQQRAVHDAFIPDTVALAVANRAGAGSLVRGFVFRQANTIRLDAQLVRASDGEVLASADAEGPRIFPLVDSVAARLATKLLPAQAETATPAPLDDVATASLDAYREYARGVAAERAMRQGDAVTHYRRAVAFDSTFPQALVRLGMSQFRAGQDSAAAASLRRAQAKLSHGPARQRDFVQGILALLRGDLTSAEHRLESLTRRYPQEKDAWVWLARAYGSSPAREGVLRQVVRLDPYNAPAYGDLALLYARRGDFARADSLAALGVAAAPGKPQPLDTRGEVLELAGRYEDARQAYLAALRLRPVFTRALADLARSAERSGRLDEARADIAPFLRAGDASVRAAALLAVAELDLWRGRASAAEKEQEQALSAATAARDTMLEDGALLALAGSWDLLGEYDRVASALAPRALTAPALLLPYAAALGSLGRLRELERLRAGAAVEMAQRNARGTDTARVATLDAYLALYRGEWSTAAARFQAAGRSRRPGGATYVNAREAVALLDAGRPADALALLRQPSDPLDLTALREHRRLYLEGRALEALGRDAEAVADYRRIQADWGSALAGFPEFRDTPERLAKLGG